MKKLLIVDLEMSGTRTLPPPRVSKHGRCVAGLGRTATRTAPSGSGTASRTHRSRSGSPRYDTDLHSFSAHDVTYLRKTTINANLAKPYLMCFVALLKEVHVSRCSSCGFEGSKRKIVDQKASGGRVSQNGFQFLC